MATTIERLAIDGLLVDINDTLPEAKLTELTSLYDVPDDNTDKFKVLKYLKDNGKLELEKLAKNLEDIGCEDQSQKVREVIDFKATKQYKMESAAFVGIGVEARETSADSPRNRKKGQYVR